MSKKLIQSILKTSDTVGIKDHNGEYILLAMDYTLTATYNKPYWLAICTDVEKSRFTTVTAREDQIELISRES